MSLLVSMNFSLSAPMTFYMEVEPFVETLCGSVLLPQPAKSASDISAAMPTAIILFLFILYTPLYKIFFGDVLLGYGHRVSLVRKG